MIMQEEDDDRSHAAAVVFEQSGNNQHDSDKSQDDMSRTPPPPNRQDSSSQMPALVADCKEQQKDMPFVLPLRQPTLDTLAPLVGECKKKDIPLVLPLRQSTLDSSSSQDDDKNDDDHQVEEAERTIEGDAKVVAHRTGSYINYLFQAWYADHHEGDDDKAAGGNKNASSTSSVRQGDGDGDDQNDDEDAESSSLATFSITTNQQQGDNTGFVDRCSLRIPESTMSVTAVTRNQSIQSDSTSASSFIGNKSSHFAESYKDKTGTASLGSSSSAVASFASFSSFSTYSSMLGMQEKSPSSDKECDSSTFSTTTNDSKYVVTTSPGDYINHLFRAWYSSSSTTDDDTDAETAADDHAVEAADDAQESCSTRSSTGTSVVDYVYKTLHHATSFDRRSSSISSNSDYNDANNNEPKTDATKSSLPSLATANHQPLPQTKPPAPLRSSSSFVDYLLGSWHDCNTENVDNKDHDDWGDDTFCENNDVTTTTTTPHHRTNRHTYRSQDSVDSIVLSKCPHHQHVTPSTSDQESDMNEAILKTPHHRTKRHTYRSQVSVDSITLSKCPHHQQTTTLKDDSVDNEDDDAESSLFSEATSSSTTDTSYFGIKDSLVISKCKNEEAGDDAIGGGSKCPQQQQHRTRQRRTYKSQDSIDSIAIAKCPHHRLHDTNTTTSEDNFSAENDDYDDDADLAFLLMLESSASRDNQNFGGIKDSLVISKCKKEETDCTF
jgi:hypothetical protein